MKIVIDGMAMPKCCYDCPLSYEYDYVDYCKVNGMRIDENIVDYTTTPVNICSTRHPKCPLREVD